MIYLYREGEGFVSISWNNELQAFLMHVVIEHWSLSEYKRYKEIFKIIKEELKKVTPFVYSLCSTTKAVRFNKAFGFKDTGLTALEANNQIAKILRLEL